MTKTRRYAPDVCDQLLAVIPLTEIPLRAELEDAKSTGQYQPPESSLVWFKIRDAFMHRFYYPNGKHRGKQLNWEQQCIAIIQGEPNA